MAEPVSSERTPTLGDPRFFLRAGPFSMWEVGIAAGVELPPQSKEQFLSGVAPLTSASQADVSFVHNTRYIADLESTTAGAVLVTEKLSAQVPRGTMSIVVPDPHVSWAKVASLFHPGSVATPGIHATAVIDPMARIGEAVQIGAHAVVGAYAEIGANCVIGPGAVIGDGVVLGESCRIGALASVSHALLGHRVYVYPGARIGQEGFGFAVTAQGFVSVPQLGRVILEDDVEIGANSTVDRGAARDTVIAAGSRIDNLVQVGHNVRIGRNCIVVAQAGIAGSAILEDFVALGAQAGVAGHVHVGKRARVGAQGGVMSDVPAGADVVGSPAFPVREFFRNVAVLRRLARKSPQEKTAG